eukprot:19908-Heterococcus_DN1.PRE.2
MMKLALLLAYLLATVAACQGSYISSPAASSLARRHRALGVRGGDVLPPQGLYNNAVAIGEKKAASSPETIFKLSVIAGTHIAFGGLLAVTVGANMGNVAIVMAAYMEGRATLQGLLKS